MSAWPKGPARSSKTRAVPAKGHAVEFCWNGTWHRAVSRGVVAGGADGDCLELDKVRAHSLTRLPLDEPHNIAAKNTHLEWSAADERKAAKKASAVTAAAAVPAAAAVEPVGVTAAPAPEAQEASSAWRRG
jgi:hypothetical protein